MKKLIFICFVTIFNPALSRENFCDISRSGGLGPFIERESNRLDFRNYGGMFDKGVCWWHSRFTRNATLLSNFVAHGDEIDIQEIVKTIRKGKRVVTIPGYADLKEFSRIYEDEIQAEIEKWQRIDGLVRQQWVVGLWGRRRLPAKKLRHRMEYLYDYMQQGNIAYLMLQLKGFSSHGWLVSSMERFDKGYKLTIIDSNYPDPVYYYYRFGDTFFQRPGYGQFIPYLAKKDEMEKLKKARAEFCSSKLP